MPDRGHGAASNMHTCLRWLAAAAGLFFWTRLQEWEDAALRPPFENKQGLWVRTHAPTTGQEEGLVLLGADGPVPVRLRPLEIGSSRDSPE